MESRSQVSINMLNASFENLTCCLSEALTFVMYTSLTSDILVCQAERASNVIEIYETCEPCKINCRIIHCPIKKTFIFYTVIYCKKININLK
jgi:hypothetical protein